MKEKITSTESASRACYETMEAQARQRIRCWLQDLLEAEVTEFLGRGKSQRRDGLEEARPPVRVITGCRAARKRGTAPVSSR